MSLIIDALRRAQQLRLNGSEGSPILNYPYPNKKKGRISKKQWIPVAAALISLCIVLFLFLRPASSPLATKTNRATVPIETKHPATIQQKDESAEGLLYAGAPLSGPPSSALAAEKPSSEPPERVLNHMKDGNSVPLPGQALSPADESTRPRQPVSRESSKTRTAPSDLSSRSEREKKSAEAKRVIAPSSLAQAPRKEDTPHRSIGVEQEGGKDSTLASEVLNLFNSGVTFYNQKEFSKAIQAYQKVIELNPRYVEAYNNLGIVYQTIGDVNRAFGAYQKATEINPGYQKGYNNLGILLLLEGRYEEALEAFRKALAINPNNIESYINLGTLFKKKGQWDEAIESYQKALEIDPLHRETHYNIALLYEQLENLELAISHYQQFIQLSSKSHSELVSKVRRHLDGLIEARKNKKQ
jgi:Flp pilus assembly protein TadD